MMMRRDLKIAISSLRTSRWRSFLTMAGVTVGLMSVIVTVSLGEGVKRQVLGQLEYLGDELLVVRPGSLNSEPNASVSLTQLSQIVNDNTTLNSTDIRVIENTPGVSEVVPLASFGSSVSFDDTNYDDIPVIGTSSAMADTLSHDVLYGAFFTSDENDQRVAVISQYAAQTIFKENVPLGKRFVYRGETFLVRGIMDRTESSPLVLGPDLGRAIFIPYTAAQRVSDGSGLLPYILVKPANPKQLESLRTELVSRLSQSRNGQEDFSVLTMEENLRVSSYILDLFARFIIGIAAISLFVGGVGVMNIMLLAVTERTREIGIRKSVGATNRQILTQFLTEAVILSLTGGLLGIAGAYLVNFGLRLTTNLQPVITLNVVLIATLVSVAVGIVFGIIPALRAARKDPIEALRADY